MIPRGKKGKSVQFVASERVNNSAPAALTLDVSTDGRRAVWKERRPEDLANLLEAPPFEVQEDLDAAALADSVDGFSYLLGENVDAQSERDATPADVGVVIRVKARYRNSVSVQLIMIVTCLLRPCFRTTRCQRGVLSGSFI